MPSITFWTRVEPFTRLEDIEDGVRARTHDPLWLLARQWQTGEFLAEDAGTPVQARVRMDRFPLARYHPGPIPGKGPLPGQPYRSDIPLEAVVEGEPVAVAGDPRRDRRLAAEAGLMFLRMLEKAGVPAAVRAEFAREPAFALAAAVDDPLAGHDPDADGYLAIMSGRVPDGFELHRAFALSLASTPPGLPPRPQVPTTVRPKMIAAAQGFVAWFAARHAGPAATGGAWVPERMEYAFAVSAATGFPEFPELTFAASEYHGGTLDWHSFDSVFDVPLGVSPSDPHAESLTRTVIPAPVRYPGMAADRWWQFEDSAVNLSRIEGDPDELLRLLLVQFSLLYSNDWYILPVDATLGAAYNIRSLVVTDAFGERTLVKHYRETTSSEWTMYAVDPLDVLLLPPVLAASLHGEPVEEVLFTRDEVANLVWGVERLVPGLADGTIDRQALHRRRPSEPASPSPSGELRYRLASPVPPHWIPFQPQRIDPDEPAIRLRRAATILDATGEPTLAHPIGRILEPGHDLTLFEEEVPATGIKIARHYQYARWVSGQTLLWLARHKTTARAVDSSNLRYDTLDEVP